MTQEWSSVRVVITGTVQGVGYRHWTERRATGDQLSGFVRNRLDGSVEAVFAGPRAGVEDMVARCRVGPRGAVVQSVSVEPWSSPVEAGFRVLPTA